MKFYKKNILTMKHIGKHEGPLVFHNEYGNLNQSTCAENEESFLSDLSVLKEKLNMNIRLKTES